MPRSNAGEYTTMEIGRSRIILGRVVALTLKTDTWIRVGLTSKPTSCMLIGRMNGLGN
jgi:hypothetical protein